MKRIINALEVKSGGYKRYAKIAIGVGVTSSMAKWVIVDHIETYDFFKNAMKEKIDLKNVIITDVDKDYFKSINIDIEHKSDQELKELKYNLQQNSLEQDVFNFEKEQRSKYFND